MVRRRLMFIISFFPWDHLLLILYYTTQITHNTLTTLTSLTTLTLHFKQVKQSKQLKKI